MQFPVTVAREARIAECGFASETDVRALSRWVRQTHPGDAMPVLDTAEYAGLAADKWGFYRDAGRLANSLAELRAAIKRDPMAEVAALLIVRAEWHRPAPQLGFCLFRRSWSHNLLVDFLGIHPAHLRDEKSKIRGIATGLLYHVMALGEALDAGSCWGEATDQSAGFYRKQFRKREIQDQFNVTAAEQWHFMEKTRADWTRTGLSLQLQLQ